MRRAVGARLSFGLIVLLTSACGDARKIPPVPSDAEVTDFHTLFDQNCVGCHGQDGMKGPGPRLNDPVYLAVADKDELISVIANGRTGTPMPPFGHVNGGPLSPLQVQAIVDGMIREWSRNVSFNGVAVPTYSVAKAPPGDPAHGQAAYMKECMMCHGFAKFKGAAGAIADPNYLAIASDQGLRTTMIVGRLDWGMPDWRHRIPGHPTSDQDISDITAWLASMRPKYALAKTANANPAPNGPVPQVSTSTGGMQSSQEK